MMELKYYKLRSKFDQDVSSGSVVTDDLVFIEDTKELYTHNTFFGQSDYCILNYDNIESSTGDPYVGNIDSTINIYIQVGVFITPATKYNSARNINYIGSIIQSTGETLNVHYITITLSAPPNRTFSAKDESFETSAVTSNEKTILTNLLGKTYIAGDELVDHAVDSVELQAYSFSTGSVSSGSGIVIDKATQTTAGVMSADDKKSLDSLVSTLKTYNVIKTQSLLSDKFIVGLDGVPVAASTISSSIVSSKPGSGISPVGLYIVTNYISGSKASVVVKGSDNKYYTQWDQFTDQAGNVIPAYNKQVGSDYVIKDNNQNISTKTLFTYRHYASQDITSMYHAKSDGTVVQASELINDYVYEKTLRS